MLGKLVAPSATLTSLSLASRDPSPQSGERWREDYIDIPFRDPNTVNLVVEV
jgi:carbamoyl-phosphate synthase/aspartate carbamoyltransferase